MAKTVGIGIQSFEEVIEGNYFYIDKTSFIKEWWESGDSVTLITRPRRFGKTLNMSMLEDFSPWVMQNGEICLRDSLSGKRKNIGIMMVLWFFAMALFLSICFQVN